MAVISDGESGLVLSWEEGKDRESEKRENRKGDLLPNWGSKGTAESTS